MIIIFEIINIEDGLVATTSADLPVFIGHSRQKGRGFGALHKQLGRQPFRSSANTWSQQLNK